MLDRQKLLLGRRLDDVRKKHVCVVGVGAIGSNIAINLARNGFTRITLIDPDEVTEENIGTQEYSQEDIGTKKATALARTLKKINPRIKINIVANKFQESEAQIRRCDVVMDGLDSMRERFKLNEIAVKNRKEYILSACAGFSGLSAYFPVNGPCMECVFPGRKVRETRCGPRECEEAGNAIGVLPETARATASVSTSLLLTGQKAVLIGFGLNTGSMEKITIRKRAGCPVCGDKNVGS